MLNDFTQLFGMAGLQTHASQRAQKWQAWLHWPMFGATLLSIPAFYLELVVARNVPGEWGRVLYGIVALAYALHLGMMWAMSRSGAEYLRRNWLDGLLLLGFLLSQAGSFGAWSGLEWGLRMLLVALVVVRLLGYLRQLFNPQGVLPILLIGAATLMLSGAGFYWLEPGIHSYGDGLWLAFTTGATVGYGDLVPRTPAGKVFAVFVVMLGFALFSLVTASIAAFFVGEDEQKMRRELHHDIRALRDEVAALRAQMRAQSNGTLPPVE